jgi:hypothetical protein
MSELDMNYFRAIQGAMGLDNMQQVVAEETKKRLKAELLSSLNCEYLSKRNGVNQYLVVTPTDKVSVMDVFALPDEGLDIGDLIDCYDQKWLVLEKFATNTLQWRGKMRQCNYQFRFQLGTSEIYEYWGVLDSGVYSTTESNTPIITTPDQQFKVYLQKDVNTSKIPRGKKLAVEKVVNEDGTTVLQVYEVTAIDGVSKNYGGGHLLELKVRSGLYNPSGDDLEQMICDYIPPSPAPNPDPGNGSGDDGENPGGGGWF